MPSGTIRAKAEQLLQLAGIRVNGDRPWDIQVHDERLFARVMAEGSLGLGESYMDGWWDAPQLDDFIARVLSAELDTKVQPWKEALGVAWARLVNLQRRGRAFQISMLPSVRQIGAAVEGKFVIEDWHSFGPDYDTTLMHWHHNVEEHWPELQDRYDERFHRMWTYFLLSSAGGFRARKNQLWQLVLSPCGVAGGYAAPR